MEILNNNYVISCLCDVTLSVYPHRAGLKNMPATVGFEPKTFGILAQASYSPEYITPTQQILCNKYCAGNGTCCPVILNSSLTAESPSSPESPFHNLTIP